MLADKQEDTRESMQEITTIKLARSTKSRLDHIRFYKRETYDEILQNLLAILNICRINPERARAKLIALDKAKKRDKSPSKRDDIREVGE